MPVSIDIGTRNIHLVTGSVSGNKVNIDRAIMETLPAGLVQDGIIREFGGLEIAMRNMLQKNKIREKACSITINGSHVYTREIDVPKAAPKVLSNVVTFEVQNAMNSNKETVVEFVATKQQNVDKPTLVHVRASAINTEYILDYGKLLNNLKLKPVAMDIHPNAINKLTSNRTINNSTSIESNIMLIDVGCVSSTAYVISNGDITYTRIIPIGGIDIERYVINYNNNEKTDKHIDLDRLDLSLNNLRMNQALGDAVRPLVLALSDGVNRIQQFLSGRIQGNKIEKIYIYGRTSTFKGFEETLTESMNLSVESVKSLSDVRFASDLDPAPFLNAIGALIRL